MCVTWPNIYIVINTTNEHSKFSWRTRPIHVQYGVDLLSPWLHTSWCKQMTKPASLFDGLFTLKWVDSKTILTKSLYNNIQSFDVISPDIGEDTYIIYVNITFFNSTKNIFHCCLYSTLFIHILCLRSQLKNVQPNPCLIFRPRLGSDTCLLWYQNRMNLYSGIMGN